jgi:hypothetical protein
MAPVAHTAHCLYATSALRRRTVVVNLLIFVHMEVLLPALAHLVPFLTVWVSDDSFIGGDLNFMGECEPVITAMKKMIRNIWE